MELEERRNEKRDREKHELEEDRAHVLAITSQIASEKNEKEQHQKALRRQVQEYGELLREKERDKRAFAKARVENEREAAELHMALLERRECERREHRENRRRAFERHQQVVDNMVTQSGATKGDKKWIANNDIAAERKEHELIKETMEKEKLSDGARKAERAARNREGLDKQVAEKRAAAARERKQDAVVHKQLLRHLQRVEEKEKTRKLYRRKLEVEHKKTLDDQVDDRRRARVNDLTAA
eukprot:TRINITY_DN10552_c0_g1_i1.p1 TRINITY_DN10552_c0_g1~~TRINITY_DN10552_c0_g1_i1.p1  ORF type:complete len:242 (+),score=55.60 TRINITY_DN10552_c0_g1_i1:232-957(+)